MSIHRKLTGEQVHTPITWEYDDATARTGATGFISTDVGKLAWQKDDDSIWLLTAIDPVWASFGSSGGSSLDISPSVTTGTATEITGNGFVVPVTLTSFGLIDINRMVLNVEYRESGSSTWIDSEGLYVSSLGTFNINVFDLTISTEYEYRAKGYDALFSINFDVGDTNTETTTSIYIEEPVNSSPLNTATNIEGIPTLEGSSFNCIGDSDIHESSDWEIYSDSERTNLVWSSYDDTSNLESIIVSENILTENTTYYWRCKYKGTTYMNSNWSTLTSFTTFILLGPYVTTIDYDSSTDTGYYGYVGSGNEVVYSAIESYDTGDIVNDGNDHFYYSKIDSNIGNALSAIKGSNSNWRWIGYGSLIYGDFLALEIGLSDGTNQFSDSGWLKFYVGSTADCNAFVRRGETGENYIAYVSLKPYRYNLSWDHIYDVGAVFNSNDDGPHYNSSGSTTTQDTKVTIDNNEYGVRLLLGASSDPMASVTACADSPGADSEWNHLIYRVHECVPECSTTPCANSGRNFHSGPQVNDNWENFTYSDIGIGDKVTYPSGCATICQEQRHITSRIVFQGGYGLSGGGFNNTGNEPKNHIHSMNGWRPVLELIQS